MSSFKTLLQLADNGHMPATAYDTAWIARLGDVDRVMSNHALGWITEHQLEDGSWGTPSPHYYHDRVICTLAAMTALTRRGRRASDRKQIENGLLALERISNEADGGLAGDFNGATVGFELIAPTLVSEAESLGILARQGDRILGRLNNKRAHKLEALKGARVNRHLTAAFSAEMAGVDFQSLLDVPNLQEGNGSVGNSPSASAYYALHVCPAEPTALQYLRSVIQPDGGAPNVAPFDVFERAWILWNLALNGPLSDEILVLCQPHLDFLQKNWIPGQGIGWAAGYTPKDADDSGLVWEVLSRFGRTVDLDTLFTYEEEDCFRCFAFEANRSVSTNIHVLGALRQAGFPPDHPSVQKIVRYLQQAQNPAGYWVDKWHASPYYASAHLVVTCAGYLPQLAENSVQWLLKTQDGDGAWGFYQPTAEETAYSLQALCAWDAHEEHLPGKTLKQGAIWLEDHQEPPYPALWIGKCLYLPELVVRAAIRSALLLQRSRE